MKKVKRALLGTVLAGAVVVGASVGTYSWFNAQVVSSGNIQNYTLELNDGAPKQAIVWEVNKRLAPSRTVNGSFEIKNTGELDQDLRFGVKFNVNDDANSPLLSGYRVKAIVKYYPLGSDTPNSTVESEFMELGQLSTWLNEKSIEVFPSGAKLGVELTVRLESDADNQWQGATLNGEIEVDGRQTDNGALFND
jgi:spore coat-associated protein N